MAVTQDEIIAFLANNPTAEETQAAMAQYGVSPAQVASALQEMYADQGATQTVQTGSGEQPQTVTQDINYGGGFRAWENAPEIIGVSGEGENQAPIYATPTLGGFTQQVGDKLYVYDTQGNFLRTQDTQQSFAKQAAPFAQLAAPFVGEYLSGLLGSGAAEAELLQQAMDADLAAGLLPEFGTNAAYDATMAELMANSPGAIAQLEAITASQGVGGLFGPDNIDIGGGWNPAGTSTTIVPSTASTTVSSVSPTTTTPTTSTSAPTSGTTGLTSSQLANLIKAGTGLLGTSALVSAVSDSGNGVGALPTQGVPTGNQDYYNAIQQYYNAYMPAAPRDVATPLQNWYNNKYGA